jgi:hypothetical protein
MGETCSIRLWEREAIYEEAEAAKALAAGQSRVGVFTTDTFNNVQSIAISAVHAGRN